MVSIRPYKLVRHSSFMLFFFSFSLKYLDDDELIKQLSEGMLIKFGGTCSEAR